MLKQLHIKSKIKKYSKRFLILQTFFMKIDAGIFLVLKRDFLRDNTQPHQMAGFFSAQTFEKLTKQG